MDKNPYEPNTTTKPPIDGTDRTKKIRNINGLVFIISLIALHAFSVIASKQFEKWSADEKSNLVLTDDIKREFFIVGAIILVLGLTVIISALITLVTTIKVALRKKAPSS